MIKKTIQNLFWHFNYDLSKIYFDEVSAKKLISLLKPVKYPKGKLIRVGNKNGDGGYLIPDDLNDIDHLFSLGVGEEFSFETELLSKDINVFLADYTVSNNKFNNLKLNFTKLYIKNYNSINSIRFDDWKDKKLGNHDNGKIILQIDIEGDEYSVIPTIKKENLLLTKFLVVEFHFLTRIFDKKFNKDIISCLERISEYFFPVHLHVNNTSNIIKKGKFEIPHTLEVTFANKNCFTGDLIFSKDFPNNLDRPCVSKKKEINLPKIFFE